MAASCSSAISYSPSPVASLTNRYNNRHSFDGSTSKASSSSSTTTSSSTYKNSLVVRAVRSYTLYDVLEVSPDVGFPDIKQAYRQLARRYHPDVCRSEESTRRFIEIQEAYETLSDPRLRAIYDHAVAMGRGSATTGRMPWTPNEQTADPSDWKSQWEVQLSALKHRSSMKARRKDSWAARVRRQNEQT